MIASADYSRAAPAPGRDQVWADWVAIWQSELAAMAADREVQETVQRGVDLWAKQALAVSSDDAAGRARPVAAPGTASPLASSRDERPANPGSAAAQPD